MLALIASRRLCVDLLAVAVTMLFLGCGVAVQEAPRPKKPESKIAPYSVAGRFEIDIPKNGFKWEEVATKGIDGIKAGFYVCADPGSTAKMIMIIERRNADSDAKKIAAAKGHWNGVMESVKAKNFKNHGSIKPKLDPPMPKQVYYQANLKDAQGDPLYFRGATVFEKNIYAFQVFASTAEEADSLIRVVETLEEKAK